MAAMARIEAMSFFEGFEILEAAAPEAATPFG